MTEDFGRDDLNYFFNHVYKDRGILKWQGMFLSEHTAELNKIEEMEKEVPRLSQQSQAEIAYYLERSLKYNKLLSVQLNSLDLLGQTKHNIVGVFRGFSDPDTILINEEYIPFEDIRHIQMKEFQKWSQVDEQPFEEVEIDIDQEELSSIDLFFEEYYDGDFYEEEDFNDFML